MSASPAGEDAERLAERGMLIDAAAGSREAFAHLYDLTSAGVLGLILSRVGDRRSAEDLLLETYVRAWQRACDFAAYHGAARAWICALALQVIVERSDGAAQEPAA